MPYYFWETIRVTKFISKISYNKVYFYVMSLSCSSWYIMNVSVCIIYIVWSVSVFFYHTDHFVVTWCTTHVMVLLTLQYQWHINQFSLTLMWNGICCQSFIDRYLYYTTPTYHTSEGKVNDDPIAYWFIDFMCRENIHEYRSTIAQDVSFMYFLLCQSNNHFSLVVKKFCN